MGSAVGQRLPGEERSLISMQKLGLLSQFVFFRPCPLPRSTALRSPLSSALNPLASIRAPLVHRLAPRPVPPARRESPAPLDRGASGRSGRLNKKRDRRGRAWRAAARRKSWPTEPPPKPPESAEHAFAAMAPSRRLRCPSKRLPAPRAADYEWRDAAWGPAPVAGRRVRRQDRP